MTLYLGKQQVAMTMNHIDESAVAQKVDKVTTPNIVYGTDSNGDQTTYDKNSFGQVDDVKVNGTSVVDNKVASITLGTMANETASEYTKTTNLSTVATSGSYNDLSDKPSIPAAQVNSDWNATSGVAQILNKPTLGTMSSENTTSYYTKTELDGKLDSKQDIATAVNYDNITNCITEIPQDIKLELNNGTLTLKAGSKVYKLDGTPITINTDVSLATSYYGFNQTCLIYYSPLNNSLETPNVAICFSGSGYPTITTYQYMLYFDTTAKTYYWTSNNGTSWTERTSNGYPIAIATIGESSWQSIDQVFNGFGYIGSTVFALPGVKGLIPNGRNTDGSLKNIEFKTTNVKTTTIDANWIKQDWFIYSNEFLTWYPLQAGEVNYNESKNLWLDTRVASGVSLFCKVGYTTSVNGKITSFTPKTAFHALDYNDKSTISGWAMPSSKYIDLTLGASGATYTAPANGWFTIDKGASDSQFINMQNYTNLYGVNSVNGAGGSIRLLLPVLKGDKCYVSYSASGTLYGFRFIYAVGEGESNV